MLLYLIKLHLVFLLIHKAHLQSPFLILTSDYDYTNYLQTMQRSCAYSPKTTLNLCSNKCLQCSASDSNKCSLCTSQFNNVRQECVIDNSIHSYTFHRYLQTGDINKMAPQISSFIDVSSNTNLSSAKIVYNCKMDLFQMLLAGMFTVDDRIGIPYKLPYSIDQIQVKVNFMSIIHDVSLIINVNQETILKKNFSIFSDIGGVYGIKYTPNTAIQQKLYLLLYALDYSTVNNIITSVDTGAKNVIANDFIVSLRTQTNNTIPDYKYYWGFSDVVIIQRRCETCVSEQVMKLISQVAEMAKIVGGILCFLVLLLFAMIYVEELMRKAKTKVKMGLVENKRSFTGDNLPERAIKRLFIAIERTKIAMEKDQKVKQTGFKRAAKRK